LRAVILAAGKGTRMMPLTKSRPKMMIPIINRPILEHIMTSLRDAGIGEILLVVGHLGDMIQEHFGDGRGLGVHIDYATQDNRPGAKYGTAIGAGLARDFVGDEPFLLAFGDIMTPPENYAGLVASYRADPDCAFLCVNYMADVSGGGAVFVQDGRVIDMVEKPTAGSVDTNFINSGIFILRPRVFEVIDELQPSLRGEYELTAAVVDMIRQGIPTNAYELEGYWSNVGGPTEVMWLNRLMLQRMAEAPPDNGVPAGVKGRIEGPVFFGDDVRVHRNATITGPSIIGDGCVIGESQVGSFTSLAEECRVGDGAHLMACAAFSRTTIGDNCHVGYALLGSGVCVQDDAWLLGSVEATTVIADNHVISVN